MKLDRDLYLVISELDNVEGFIILEVELSRMDIVTVTRDILTGQYADVLAVIQINVAEKICRDCTHDFQTVIDDHREAVADARRGR